MPWHDSDVHISTWLRSLTYSILFQHAATTRSTGQRPVRGMPGALGVLSLDHTLHREGGCPTLRGQSPLLNYTHPLTAKGKVVCPSPRGQSPRASLAMTVTYVDGRKAVAWPCGAKVRTFQHSCQHVSSALPQPLSPGGTAAARASVFPRRAGIGSHTCVDSMAADPGRQGHATVTDWMALLGDGRNLPARRAQQAQQSAPTPSSPPAPLQGAQTETQAQAAALAERAWAQARAARRAGYDAAGSGRVPPTPPAPPSRQDARPPDAPAAAPSAKAALGQQLSQWLASKAAQPASTSAAPSGQRTPPPSAGTTEHQAQPVQSAWPTDLETHHGFDQMVLDLSPEEEESNVAHPPSRGRLSPDDPGAASPQSATATPASPRSPQPVDAASSTTAGPPTPPRQALPPHRGQGLMPPAVPAAAEEPGGQPSTASEPAVEATTPQVDAAAAQRRRYDGVVRMPVAVKPPPPLDTQFMKAPPPKPGAPAQPTQQSPMMAPAGAASGPGAAMLAPQQRIQQVRPADGGPARPPGYPKAAMAKAHSTPADDGIWLVRPIAAQHPPTLTMPMLGRPAPVVQRVVRMGPPIAPGHWWWGWTDPQHWGCQYVSAAAMSQLVQSLGRPGTTAAPQRATGTALPMGAPSVPLHLPQPPRHPPPGRTALSALPTAGALTSPAAASADVQPPRQPLPPPKQASKPATAVPPTTSTRAPATAPPKVPPKLPPPQPPPKAPAKAGSAASAAGGHVPMVLLHETPKPPPKAPAKAAQPTPLPTAAAKSPGVARPSAVDGRRHGEALAVTNAGRTAADCTSVPGEDLAETRRLNVLDPGRHFDSPLWEEYVRSLPPRVAHAAAPATAAFQGEPATPATLAPALGREPAPAGSSPTPGPRGAEAQPPPCSTPVASMSPESRPSPSAPTAKGAPAALAPGGAPSAKEPAPAGPEATRPKPRPQATPFWERGIPPPPGYVRPPGAPGPPGASPAATSPAPAGPASRGKPAQGARASATAGADSSAKPKFKAPPASLTGSEGSPTPSPKPRMWSSPCPPPLIGPPRPVWDPWEPEQSRRALEAWFAEARRLNPSF